VAGGFPTFDSQPPVVVRAYISKFKGPLMSTLHLSNGKFRNPMLDSFLTEIPKGFYFLSCPAW
jgi:hypothetical protein